MLLFYLKINYKICLYDFSSWGKEKKDNKTVLNHITLPVLETNNLVISQSNAILYYLDNKYSQNNYDINDNTKSLMLLGIVEDIRLQWLKPIFSNKDEDKANFINNYLPSTLKNLEFLLNDNDYYIKNKPIYSDIAVFEILNSIENVYGNYNLNKYAKLHNFYNNMYKVVKNYLNSRKVNAF
jgi:glutathione S-transferase